jgi:hypothetical protein
VLLEVVEVVAGVVAVVVVAVVAASSGAANRRHTGVNKNRFIFSPFLVNRP